LKYSVKSTTILVPLLALSILIVAYLAYTAQRPEPAVSAETITVQPKKPLYRVGEVVEVSGVVGGPAEGGRVELKMLAPAGDVWAEVEVFPQEESDSLNLFFNTTLGVVSDRDSSGIYMITVKYGGLENRSSVLISTHTGVSTELLDVRVQNIMGTELRDVRLGDTAMIAGVVVNRGVEGEFTFMVEVRDQSLRRVHLGYVSADIDRGSSKTFTVGWPTRSIGVFTIYVYVKPDFQSRMIISDVKTVSFQVRP